MTDPLSLAAFAACIAVMGWTVRETAKLTAVVTALTTRMDGHDKEHAGHAKRLDSHSDKFDTFKEVETKLAVIAAKLEALDFDALLAALRGKPAPRKTVPAKTARKK